VLGAAAAQGITLVIYMGMARLEGLQQALLKSLPAATSAAAVQHAGAAGERQVVTTLGQLAEVVRREGLGSPAILIIGDVLRARTVLAAPEVRAA
jgi:uroporphyrin-III C-methyltransferase